MWGRGGRDEHCSRGNRSWFQALLTPPTAATPATGLPGVLMLNLRLWPKPTLVVFCSLQTQESGVLHKLLGAQALLQSLLGDAGRKGALKEGKSKRANSQKGEGEGGMKQGWCGQAARKPLTMGGLVPPRDGGGEGSRGRGKRQEGAAQLEGWASESTRGLTVRKAASLRPLRNRNTWGGAPRSPYSRCKFKFQRHQRQSPQAQSKAPSSTEPSWVSRPTSQTGSALFHL